MERYKQYFKEEDKSPFVVNGIKGIFNPLWNMWQLSISDGENKGYPYGEFKTRIEAIEFAKKGR